MNMSRNRSKNIERYLIKGGWSIDSAKVIRFPYLAIKERLKLTDEEVNKFIDLECAFEGIK